MREPRIAALADDWCNASISLDLGGALEALALGSQSCNQPGDQCFAGSRQRIEHRKIGVRFSELRDPLLTSGDILLQPLDYPHRGLYHEDTGLNHGPVVRRRHSLADFFQSALLILAIVPAEEGRSDRGAAFCAASNVGQRDRKSHVTGELSL